MDSRDISNRIKDSSRTEVIEYGKDKLPSGDLSSKELIVVEGRADVINLMKNGVKNVIAMNGTNLPETIRELSEEKEVTLFIDDKRQDNELKQLLFSLLGKILVFTKKPGKEVIKTKPLVLPKGAKVEDAVKLLHKEIADKLRYVRVWGSTSYHQNTCFNEIIFSKEVTSTTTGLSTPIYPGVTAVYTGMLVIQEPIHTTE